MKRALLALTLALAGAHAPTAAQASQPSGWSEAVVSVRDLAAASELFEQFGWSVVGRGRVGRAELDYWHLPRLASAQFRKICARPVREGCIRFIAFSGVPQRPIRLGTRPWDTGGTFSLMIRTDNVRAAFDAAIAAGWHAESEPYRFAFGSSDLWNVVLSSPQGFNIALYERVSPPFNDYPLTRLSQAFNAMRMVRDQRASVAFYTRLGFSKAFDSDYVDPAPTTTNFSIPKNYATRIVRRAAAMHPVASGTGRVELMQFVGFEGKDQSAYAAAPNLGILSLRFPVRGLADYRARLVEAGVPAVQRGEGIAIGALGRVDVFAVRDPDGNLNEFYAESADDGLDQRPVAR